MVTASPHLLLILAISLVNLVFFYRFYLHLKRTFKRIETDLIGGINFLSKYGRNEATDPVLKAEIETYLRSLPSVEHAWNEFSETLIREKDDNGEYIYNTTDANQFVHADAIIFGDNQLKYRFGVFGSIPQITTSIGIVGTFISVILAMPSIIPSGSQSETIIPELLSSLKWAFISSLVGVLLAAAYTFIERMCADELEALCIRLADKLNFVFIRKTEHLYLSGLLQKQDQISASIKSAMADLGNQVISDFRNIATSDPSIQEGVKAAVQQGFNHLAATLEKMHGLQQIVMEGSERIHSLQASQVDTLSNLLNKTFHTSTAVEKAAVDITGLTERLESLARVLTETSAGAMSTLEPFSRRITTIKESIDQYEKTSSQSTQAQERILTRIATELENLKAAYTGFNSNVQTFTNDNVSMLESNLEQFDKSIGSALGGINGSVESFNGVVSLLSRTVEGMDKRIELLEKSLKARIEKDKETA